MSHAITANCQNESIEWEHAQKPFTGENVEVFFRVLQKG